MFQDLLHILKKFVVEKKGQNMENDVPLSISFQHNTTEFIKKGDDILETMKLQSFHCQ